MTHTTGTALVERMATRLHPNPDGEDEATAFVCASGISDWVLSPEVRAAALAEVDRQARDAGGHLTYGATVDAVLKAVAEASQRESV